MRIPGEVPGQRRRFRPQPLVARAGGDTLRGAPVRPVGPGRQVVHQRAFPLRRRAVEARPEIPEVAREEQVALVAEGVEEPVDRTEREAQASFDEAPEAESLNEILAAIRLV